MKQYLPFNPQQNTNWKLRITQKFWVWPEYYNKFWFLWHEWIDINPIAWKSTPIYATFDWNCFPRSGWAYWKRIDLYDDKWVVASYCHLKTVSIIRKQRVKAWDLIWYSWTTWNSWAIHLHFMIRECNPKTWEIYNPRNWYWWSLKIEFDSQANKLFIDTKKQYFWVSVDLVIEAWSKLDKETIRQQAKMIWELTQERDKYLKALKTIKSIVEQWV